MDKVLDILINRFRQFPFTGDPRDYYEEIGNPEPPLSNWEKAMRDAHKFYDSDFPNEDERIWGGLKRGGFSFGFDMRHTMGTAAIIIYEITI